MLSETARGAFAWGLRYHFTLEPTAILTKNKKAAHNLTFEFAKFSG
jgi:hypothetical protein